MPAEILACPHLADGKIPFLMRTPARRPLLECWRCALRNRRMLRRSIITALFVGTLLTAINQGHLLIDQDFHWDLAWRILLTYTVPFLVATFGALGNARITGTAR